jgi:hypothetical protein
MALTIAQIRQQYPQYRDMSDQQLADSLHTKFYSDMPRDEFNQKIGLSPQQGSGFLGGLESLGLGAAKGAGQLGQGLLIEGTKLAGKAFPSLLQKVPAEQEYYKAIGQFYDQPHAAQQHPTTEAVGSFLGGTLPLMAIPEVKALSLAPEAGLAAKTGAAIAKGAGAGAALAPAFSPQESLGEAAKKGAIVGGIAAPLGEALSKFSPSEILKNAFVNRNISPEEFEHRLASIPTDSKGNAIKVPLGDVAESPALQKTYGMVSAMLGSGAGKPYQQLSEVLTAGKNALEEGASPNANREIYDAYNREHEAAKEATNDAYNNLAKLADTTTTPYDSTALKESINEELAKYPTEKMDPATKKSMSDVLSTLETHKESLPESFTGAKLKLQAVNKELRAPEVMNNLPLKSALMSVKNGLQDSIDKSSEASPELNQAFIDAKNARKFQGEFEKTDHKVDSPFYSIKKRMAEPMNLINSYVKPNTGTNDYAPLLAKLTSKLPEDAKQTLAASYLKSDSLSNMVNKLKKLSPEQRSLLLGNKADIGEQMLDLSKLYPKGKNPGWVQPTGFTGGQAVQAGSALMSAIKAGTGLGAVQTLGAIPAAGQAAQRFLRSDFLKDQYLRALRSTPEVRQTLLRQLAARGALPAAVDLTGDNKRG